MPPPPTAARVSVWEGMQVGLLVIDIGWTTLCLGGFRAETMIVTSSLTALLLIVHFGGRAVGADSILTAGRGERRAPSENTSTRTYRRVHPASWWLLPFLAYAAFNAGWLSPVLWLGWDDVLRWTQLIAVFWVVLNGVRGRRVRGLLLQSLLAIGGLAAAMAIYQRTIDHEWMMLGRRQALQFLDRASGPFGNPNSLAALLILLLPVAGAMVWQRGLKLEVRLARCALAVLLAVGLVLTVSRGAWLGLAIALTLWPLLVPGRHWSWRAGVALGVLVLLMAVVSTLYTTVPAIRYRWDKFVEDSGEKSRPVMWRAAWKLFRERPAVGTGAGSYPELFEKYRPEYFTAEPHWAHNDYLNTLSDYGLVGFGLLAAGVAAMGTIAGRAVLRAEPKRRDEISLGLALTVGILAFSLHLLVDFHLKMPALAMVLAACAALAMQQLRPMHKRVGFPTRAPKVISGTIVAVIFCGTAMAVLPHYRSEAWRDDWRRAIDRSARDELSPDRELKLFREAAVAFARATEIDPAHSQAWADRAFAMELAAKFEPQRIKELGLEAERSARQALTGSQVIFEFWLRLGVALDMQGRWLEAGEAFVQAMRLAPAKSETWFHHAYHLSLHLELHEMREIALSEVAISLRLDPRNHEAEALRQRLRTIP